MITDKNLETERPHSGAPYIDGVQRIYRLANGYRLSLINGQRLRAYPFAWEGAVIYPEHADPGGLAYDTPLTEDVEVFDTDDEANAWIERAIARGEENAK